MAGCQWSVLLIALHTNLLGCETPAHGPGLLTFSRRRTVLLLGVSTGTLCIVSATAHVFDPIGATSLPSTQKCLFEPHEGFNDTIEIYFPGATLGTLGLRYWDIATLELRQGAGTWPKDVRLTKTRISCATETRLF